MTMSGSRLIAKFERDCIAAGLTPVAVVEAAGVHKSLWWKWRSGAVSPTLRNFEAAQDKLREMAGRRTFTPLIPRDSVIDQLRAIVREEVAAIAELKAARSRRETDSENLNSQLAATSAALRGAQ